VQALRRRRGSSCCRRWRDSPAGGEERKLTLGQSETDASSSTRLPSWPPSHRSSRTARTRPTRRSSTRLTTSST
jgi:hypothetical protein